MTSQNNVVISAKSQGIAQVMKEINALRQSLRSLNQQGQQAKSTYSERQQRAKEHLTDRRTKTGIRKSQPIASSIAGRGLNVAEAGAVAGMQGAIDPALTGQQRAIQTMQNIAADEMLPDSSKFGKAEAKAFDQMNTQYDRVVEKGALYERQQRELGHAAKISAKETLGLRVQIEKLRASQSFQTNATSEQVNRLKMLEAQMIKMQAQAVKNTSSFQFMAGASVLVQRGIRNIGAAAQGAMLAMSMLNGDVMGMAFSLIFLQFAANLPVALGFGAIAIAGVLAFKAIKKVYNTKKEVREFTEAFKIATGNVEAYSLAQDRAGDVVASLGVKGDEQKEAIKVATNAIMDMEMRRQKVTTTSIGVAVKAWLVAGRTAKDEAERQNTALDAVQKHMEGNQMTINGYGYDLKRLNQAATRELIQLGGSFMAYGKTVEEAMIAMGASEKELQDVSHEMLQMTMADLFESTISHDESKNKMMRWFNDMEIEYEKDYGEQQERVLGMIEEFDRENDAKEKSVSRLKGESEKEISQMWAGVDQKRLSNERLMDLDSMYVESFKETTDEIIADMKRLEDASKQAPPFLGFNKSQLAEWKKDTSKQVLHERDREFKTGEYLGKDMFTETYGGSQEHFSMEFDGTGYSEEIVITIEDQTRGGLDVTQTIAKQMAGVVTSSIGMASESGDF